LLTDIWGWTDAETGREYALVGKHDGIAVVDLSNPTQPEYVAFVDRPAGSLNSGWSDIKVYRDHAFYVADAAGRHGLGIIDLARIREASNADTLKPTVVYDGFGFAPGLAVNEETGFAYVVGSSGDGNTCGGGLHMVDIRNPLEPEFAGCYALESVGIRRTGYTHDVQCVTYSGPDVDFRGREVCFGSNETAITIVDVTDKREPVTLAAASYPMVAYAHQGWLSEDHRYFYQNDELDEAQFGSRMRTIIWDLSKLEEPVLAGVFEGEENTIDHNLFVSGQYLFQANYTSGLRVLDISDPTAPTEVAFFDTTPGLDGVRFGGAWGVYPFFDSGLVVVSSMGEGLFVLDPQLETRTVTTNEPVEVPNGVLTLGAYPNPLSESATIELHLAQPADITLELLDMQGRLIRVLHEGMLQSGQHQIGFDAIGLSAGKYMIRALGQDHAESHGLTVVR
jgi:choice-of-anchor B domain-containing protein